MRDTSMNNEMLNRPDDYWSKGLYVRLISSIVIILLSSILLWVVLFHPPVNDASRDPAYQGNAPIGGGINDDYGPGPGMPAPPIK